MKVQVFILKKRFALFEHVVSIPFSRMIISTKPGNEMTTGNYGIEITSETGPLFREARVTGKRLESECGARNGVNQST